MSDKTVDTPEFLGETLLEVRGLVQYFDRPLSWLERCLGRAGSRVHAVNGVDFRIFRGEVFSLVGESGCGKSTTARTVVRLLEPKSGQVFFEGRDIAQLDSQEMMPYRRKIQMVFQNPYASLDPRQKIGDIIMEPILFHKLATSRDEAREQMLRLLDRIGLQRDQADRYPHQFSGGQRQRIGIARALATNPKLIVADEPVSALDVSVQAQILNLMMDLRESGRLSYLFIAHDLSVVRHVTDRLAIMYLGFIVEEGTGEEVFERPLHPYTATLLEAAPAIDKKFLHPVLPGDAPSPLSLPPGCAFASRCPRREPQCERERPPLRRVEESGAVRKVACHFPG
ncbi:MAG: ATP-binding cassette domain-containing protein [Synergistaceae bacterium]|jgi:oligopeptide/dipeptide ABC transporter ATP-binding protein|nr:ATP-binding cassette domain-containing protein [Synergistaceae bacterium]